MKKNEKKNLSLKTETVRTMSPSEMEAVNGGFKHWSCWTVTVPSSGSFTLIPITLGDC